MRYGIISQLFLLFCVLGSGAFAQERHTLIQQARTLGMGGAGVALADDEYALFNNVAGLAGNESRELKLIGLSGEGSGDIYSSFTESRNAFKKFSIDSLNVLMGKDIFMRAGATPILSAKHFALAYVVDAQFALNQFNQVNPQYKLGAMITQGIQAGYAWQLGKGRRSKEDWRVGVAAKVLWRRGGYYTLNTADLLAATQDDTGMAYLNRVMGKTAIGVGFDTGIQYVNHVDQRSEVSAGMSLTDIGDTRFKSPEAMKIPMDWSLGVGYKTAMNPFKLAVDFDYRNVLTTSAFTNRLHLGVDVGFPLFDLYTGLNQLYITYGFAFNLWIMKISALSYGEELGYRFRQNPSRRYMLQFDFKLPI